MMISVHVQPQHGGQFYKSSHAAIAPGRSFGALGEFRGAFAAPKQGTNPLLTNSQGGPATSFQWSFGACISAQIRPIGQVCKLEKPKLQVDLLAWEVELSRLNGSPVASEV